MKSWPPNVPGILRKVCGGGARDYMMVLASFNVQFKSS